MKQRILGGAGIAVALTVALAGAARADDATEKAQLEQRVQDLERELADVKSTLKGGYFTANSDLEARVGELERLAADGAMGSSFKNGLRHQSTDGAFSYQFYGLIQNDWTWYPGDANNTNRIPVDPAPAAGSPKSAYYESLNPGTEFRRLRLGVNGKMYGNVNWNAEYEFSKGTVSLADVWIELSHCVFGNIRVGHQKEPIGFDQITTDRYVQFMERSFVNTMSPGRNTGILLWNRVADDHLLYQVGMFRDSNAFGDDINNAHDGGYNLAGRLSTHTVLSDEGGSWMHFGVSGRLSNLSDDKMTLGAAPANHMAPAFLRVADVPVDSAWQYGLEAAFVTGPFTFLGEYTYERLDLVDSASSSDVYAWSVEGSVWLTGESTAYDKNKGAFGRTSPKHNYDGDGDGAGAWQLALRFDTINLNDGPIDVGRMDQWTLGARWWLNPNTAIHLNLVRAMPHDPAGVLNDETILGVRFEIDF